MATTGKPFVVLLHTGHGPDHYDLMLDRPDPPAAEPAGGAVGDGRGPDGPAEPAPLGPRANALATWRVACDPAAMAEGSELPATRLPDHRRAYLSYEGPLSGGRGQVSRIRAGTYELLSHGPARWEVRLAWAGVPDSASSPPAAPCRGRFILYCPRGAPPDASWRIARAPDR